MENLETTTEVTTTPTKEQIAAWKKQYGGVFLIEVGDKAAYLRKPNRKDLGHASTVGKKDPMKFNESILNNCWLSGDSEIKTDDNLFLGACNVLDDIIEFAQAGIKKL